MADTITVATNGYSAQIDAGDYTFQSEFDLTNTKNNMAVQLVYSNGTAQTYVLGNTIKAGTKGISVVSVNIPTAQKVIGRAVYLAANVNSDPFLIRHEKLEKGLHATPWTLNPAEIATQNYAQTLIDAKAGSLTVDLRSYATNQANNAKTAAINSASSDAADKANSARVSAISSASADATNKANSALNNAKSYADTQISAKAGEFNVKVSNADYHNLFSMNENGILLDAHGVNNSDKSIILSGDHVKIDSGNPVLIPNAAIQNLDAGKLTVGSTLNAAEINLINLNADKITTGTLNGLAVHQNGANNQTWIDDNGIHNYDNNGHEVWIRNGNITANSGTIEGLNIKGSTITGSSIHQSSSNANTWVDDNGFSNYDNNGNTTKIANGKLYTNYISTSTKVHIGNDDSDPRKFWGADIDVNGLSFTVPVKKSNATGNNPSDYQSEIQGYFNSQGWDYTAGNTKGTGYSGIAIGVATEQTWGRPYGGDFLALGEFNPSDSVPDASSGKVGSSAFTPAIAYWATGVGVSYPAGSVSISPRLYLNSELYFNKDGEGGVYFDEYGNVRGRSKSTQWKVQNRWGDVPFWVNTNGADVHIGGIFFDGGTELHARGGDLWIYDESHNFADVHGKTFVNSSLLSLKTNISKVDPKLALDKINQTNIYNYQYKDDVRKGSAKTYSSFIIDDVNEVSQYTEPEEFLSADKTGRDDGSQLAYATVAIQELSRQIEELKQEIEN